MSRTDRRRGTTVDSSADVYSLAATIHTMFTGKPRLGARRLPRSSDHIRLDAARVCMQSHPHMRKTRSAAAALHVSAEGSSDVGRHAQDLERVAATHGPRSDAPTLDSAGDFGASVGPSGSAEVASSHPATGSLPRHRRPPQRTRGDGRGPPLLRGHLAPGSGAVPISFHEIGFHGNRRNTTTRAATSTSSSNAAWASQSRCRP